MNLALLKSYKIWIAFAVAIIGVLVANGVVVEGSTASTIVGWVMGLLGLGGAAVTTETNKV